MTLNFLRNKYLKILAFFCTFLLCFGVFNNIQIVIATTPSVEQFEETFLTVNQTVEFNYTTPMGISSCKSITTSIDITGKKTVISYAAGAIISEKTSAVSNNYYYNPFTTDPLISPLYAQNDTEHFIFFKSDLNTSRTRAYNASAFPLNRTSTTKSGQLIQAVIPDPKSVASDYCRKNNLILETINNFTYEYERKSDALESLSIGSSAPVETDNNLDNGYNIIQSNSSDFGVTAAIIGISILVAFVIGMIMGSGGDNTINQNPISKPKINQTADFLNEHNNTINLDLDPMSGDAWNESYAVYLDLCNKSGIEPSMEGYMEFLKGQYPTFDEPLITYDVNVNQSAEQDAPITQSASLIAGFASTIVTIIMVVIIIIVIIVVLVLLWRMFKKKGRKGPAGQNPKWVKYQYK